MENLIFDEQQYSERSDKVFEDLEAMELDQKAKIMNIEQDRGIFHIRNFKYF